MSGGQLDGVDAVDVFDDKLASAVLFRFAEEERCRVIVLFLRLRKLEQYLAAIEGRDRAAYSRGNPRPVYSVGVSSTRAAPPRAQARGAG